MKRGLFVCYDPHALMQFLQFYCMNDFPAEWDVLCLPVENGEEYMHTYCEKTGMFRNIFVGNVEYIKLPAVKKFCLFLSMFFSAILGMRKKYCTKILNEYVRDINDYDILCANIDTGFISGMLASFAKEKDVIYFEDGAADYMIKRSKWKNSGFPLFSFTNLQCVLMAWLGYFAKGHVYFKPTKYCYKYVTNKDALEYRNFKEVREFLLDNKSLRTYQNFIKILYPELDNFIIPKDSVIFFTDPLSDLLDDYEKYVNKLIDAISERFKTVVIKKHPRDTTDYQFPPDVEVTILNGQIPGEVFFPFMKDNVCCFNEVSSVIIGLKPFVSKIIIYHIKDFDTIKLKQHTSTKVEKKEYLEKFVTNKYEIFDI